MPHDIAKKAKEILVADKKKEYVCHIQYVVEIGLRLAEEHGADPDVIEIACLLHDLGRDKELPGEEHAQTSYRLSKEMLADSNLSPEQQEKILSAILLHNSDAVPETIEQQIVRSADAGSKVEYHEAFMLMCKKPTYEERLVWGMKYLEKGYEKICLESYRNTLKKKYESIRAIYQRTMDEMTNTS